MKSAITKKHVSLFKKFTVASVMALAVVGCAIDEQYTFESSYQGATETKEVVVYSEFTGVFNQDEAETNTERRIQFSTEEAIEVNKEYVVTIDGDEFKYTTTASTDHQSLASELSQAIDGDSKYTATVENNVIRIQGGAGTSSVSATKAGALVDISEDPPVEALAVDNPNIVDVGFYHANSSTRFLGTLEAIESRYAGLGFTTKRINERLDGNAPDVSLLIVYLPEVAINSNEIISLEKHLSNGGRIFFMGEYQGIVPNENKIISDAIKTLDGSIQVLGGTHNQSVLNRNSPKNLNNSYLNAGVNSFGTGTYAELSIDPAISQAVVVDDAGRIVIADQAVSNGRITLIADRDWLQLDANVFLNNLAIDSYNNQEKVKQGTNPNENFAPAAGTVTTVYGSVVNFDILGQTLTIKSTNEKIGKEIQFESQSYGESKVKFKDEKLFVTYNKGVSTTEEIVALINAYPEFTATTTGNIIIP